ncbi:MAG: RDD family protein [Pseudomonadota bacterium]
MSLPHPEFDAAFYETIPLKRFVAFVIDFVIIAGLAGAAVLVFGILTLGIGFAFFLPITLLVGFAYRWLTIGARSATFGMLFMGVELRGRSGRHLTPQEAMLHSGIFIALTLTVIGWVATVIAIMATERHQGLPDLFLGTVAINRPAQ